MSLIGLLADVSTDPALHSAIETARSGRDPHLDLVAPAALRPFMVGALAADAPVGAHRPVLAVTATEREAADLTDALGSLLPEDSVALFPAWETLPHERLSPRSDTVGQRLAVLRRLAHPDPADPLTTPCAWWWPRSAASCNRWSPGSETWSRCGSAPVTRWSWSPWSAP